MPSIKNVFRASTGKTSRYSIDLSFSSSMEKITLISAENTSKFCLEIPMGLSYKGTSSRTPIEKTSAFSTQKTSGSSKEKSSWRSIEKDSGHLLLNTITFSIEKTSKSFIKKLFSVAILMGLSWGFEPRHRVFEDLWASYRKKESLNFDRRLRDLLYSRGKFRVLSYKKSELI